MFATVDALLAAGAGVRVHDPMYTDQELSLLGLMPYSFGSEVDVAVVQADHAAYRRLKQGDLPGIKAMIDGRGIVEPRNFQGVTIIYIGRPSCNESVYGGGHYSEPPESAERRQQSGSGSV